MLIVCLQPLGVGGCITYTFSKDLPRVLTPVCGYNYHSSLFLRRRGFDSDDCQHIEQSCGFHLTVYGDREII